MKKYQNFCLKTFIFWVVKFSVYLNRRVFVMVIRIKVEYVVWDNSVVGILTSGITENAVVIYLILHQFCLSF